MSQAFDSTSIHIPCKVLFGIPLFSSFCFQFLWTLISLYRLFLVICSVCPVPASTCNVKTSITRLIPLISIFLSLVSAFLASYHSEPFLLYRLCQGSCDQFSADDEWIAVYFSVIPAILLYLPSGVSYAAIFCLVRHARRIRNSKPENTYPRSREPSVVTAPASETAFLRVPLHKKNQHRNSLIETSTSFVINADSYEVPAYQDLVKKRL